MYKQIKRKKLGRKKSHRESLVRNQLRSLFENSYVVTTTPKAKVLKQNASSLISKGKNAKEDVSFRRELQNILGRDTLVEKFKEYIGKEKTGVGFVRVRFRDGDNAEMSRVFLLGLEKKKVKDEKDSEKEKKKKVIETKQKVNINADKKVDKTAVIKKTERAKSRSGI